MPIKTIKTQKSNITFGAKRVYVQPVVANKKALRSEDVLNLIVTVNAIDFDADEESQDRMSRVVSVANAQYNKLIASGATPGDAYTAIYHDNTVKWVGADNKEHLITIETLAAALDASVRLMGQKWIEYA